VKICISLIKNCINLAYRR